MQTATTLDEGLRARAWVDQGQFDLGHWASASLGAFSGFGTGESPDEAIADAIARLEAALEFDDEQTLEFDDEVTR